MADANVSMSRIPTSEFCVLGLDTVHFVRAGSGPAVLLVHGSGASLHVFAGVIEQLSRSCSVFALDLPGFGLTGPARSGDYSLPRYVEVVTRFIDEVVGRPCVVAGHSFGGEIAWNLAVTAPGELRGLVLMNATGYPDKHVPMLLRLPRIAVLRPLLRRLGSRRLTARGLRALAAPGSTAISDAFVDLMHGLASRPGNRAALIDFAATPRPDRSAAIPGIRTPTLVIRSDLIDGQHFARDIPQSREIVLDGVGHLMPLEAPHAVSGAIADFVVALDRRGVVTDPGRP